MTNFFYVAASASLISPKTNCTNPFYSFHKKENFFFPLHQAVPWTKNFKLSLKEKKSSVIRVLLTWHNLSNGRGRFRLPLLFNRKLRKSTVKVIRMSTEQPFLNWNNKVGSLRGRGDAWHGNFSKNNFEENARKETTKNDMWT